MKDRPRRALSNDDQTIWAAFAGRIQVLRGRSRPAPPATPPEPSPNSPLPVPAMLVTAGLTRIRRPPGLLVIGQSPGGVDKALWQRLQSGRVKIGRRLDLHGHTAQLAHQRFEHCLMQSASQGIRCLEVITGRGSGEQGGILRREFPLWLNLPHLRPLILAAVHPHAGNTGSVLLLLRRAR